MNAEVKKLEGLNYVEYGNIESPNKIILFHGYGADMHDLLGLAEFIKTKEKYHWIFPNGVLEIPLGPHMTGRGWFNIDFPQFERFMKTGEFAKRYPSGMKDARLRAEKFLKAITSDYSKSFIGGFSQGAMLTTDILLNSDIQPKGAILLSATLVNEDEWRELAKKKTFRFFQSHGKNDSILPYELSLSLNQLFTECEYDGEYVDFSGGHEIPMQVLKKLESFLNS